MAMLDDVSRVHLIGIGGIGVSGVARILAARGFEVRGSDVRRSSITDALADEGLDVRIGHDPDHLDGVDLVIRSTAIPAENIELVEAQARGIRVVHRSEVLDVLCRGRTTIGVTGTHGKGTVSSMIAWILECAGWQPGFIIGGMLENFGLNARDGERWMVVEVDESDGSHHNVRLDYMVCNFLEVDHLNYYDGLDDIIAQMERSVRGHSTLRELFLNLDCAGNRELAARIDMRPTGYSLEHATEFQATIAGPDQMPIPFRARHRSAELGEFSLNLFGRYNVVNAIGAIAVATRLGVAPEAIAEAIATYRGLENRFTMLRAGGTTIVKDYQSHPTGMRKVIESAKDLVDGRLICVFKPYRYTLINYLQDEYATAFQGSDEVLITTMYAADEDPIEGIDTEFVVRKIREQGLRVTHIPDQGAINAYLLEHVGAGDKVIFFGGDDFFRMADAFAAELARRAGQTQPLTTLSPDAGSPLSSSEHS